MSPLRESGISQAQRAALLLWVAAQVMSASSLPGQPEARHRAWKPGTEAPSISDQPVRAFAPAAAMETLNSTLLAGAAKPVSPVELWLDARPWLVHLPPRQQDDPLRGTLPPTWMLLAAATAVLATVDNPHHRRRTHPGCRHTAEPVGAIKKPRPPPWKRGERGCESAGDCQPAR